MKDLARIYLKHLVRTEHRCSLIARMLSLGQLGRWLGGSLLRRWTHFSDSLVPQCLSLWHGDNLSQSHR